MEILRSQFILPTEAANRILKLFVVSDEMDAYANREEGSWYQLADHEKDIVREVFNILEGVQVYAHMFGPTQQAPPTHNKETH